LVFTREEKTAKVRLEDLERNAGAKKLVNLWGLGFTVGRRAGQFVSEWVGSKAGRRFNFGVGYAFIDFD
jgi:hypothetical protein